MSARELHLHLRVPPGGADALRAFLARAIPFYEAPGDISVRLLQQVDDPDVFIEVVAYATVAAFDADQQRVEHDPEMQRWLAEWRTLLAGPPRVVVYAVEA
ncbi:MAG: antibiotic biosynthesis monooxygenase [Proteobacteria bacterium]|nr:antibiotic biosynthesis monooxygenase [Pseudomonadota bacterium]